MRAAYVDAFRLVTGRPLVRLPQMAGVSESEIFFDALALNGVAQSDIDSSEILLARFSEELASAMAARRDLLREQGQLLPGAAAAVAAVAKLDGVVQTVLTGTSKDNARLKLSAFDLDGFFDFEVGGYGSQGYPKGTLLRVARQRAEDKYHLVYPEDKTVYIADSPRDIAAARIGSAWAVGVASGRASSMELRDTGADAVLDDLSDTAAVVEVIEHLTSFSRP
jgi:phosphoglycolate phosphatase-like HAD superfamily hydrolase